MPEVSRFYGIIVRFYYRDHPPTHFHAIYGENEALIEIETGAIHEGYLPGTAYDLVNRWRAIRLQELRDDWNRCAAAAATFADRAARMNRCLTGEF